MSHNTEPTQAPSTVLEELRQENIKLKAEAQHVQSVHLEEMDRERRQRAAEIKTKVDQRLRQAESTALGKDSMMQKLVVEKTGRISALTKEKETLAAENSQLRQELTGQTRKAELVSGESANKDSVSERLEQQFALDLRRKETDLEDLRERIRLLSRQEESSRQDVRDLTARLATTEAEARQAKEENERLKRRGPAFAILSGGGSENNDEAAAVGPGIDASSPAGPDSRRGSRVSSPTMDAPPSAYPQASSPPSGASAGLTGPTKARYESMLQEKERKIVAQSADAVKSRQTLQQLRQQLSDAQGRNAVLESTVAKVKSEFDASVGLAKNHSTEVAELRGKLTQVDHERNVLSDQSVLDTEKIRLLEEKEASAKSFRAAHVHCSVSLEEQARTIKSLQAIITENTVELEAAAKKTEVLTQDNAQLEKELKIQLDKFERSEQQHRISSKNLNAELETLKSNCSELRLMSKEQEEALNKQRMIHLEEQTRWETEKVTLQRKITSLESDLEQHIFTSSQNNSPRGGGEEEGFYSKERQKEYEDLCLRVKELETAKAHLAGEVAALQSDVGNKKSTIRRVSLEKEEKEQQYARLEKSYRDKCDKVEMLIDQIIQLEGNDGAGTTTSRRVIGLLEALNSEMCRTVGEGLLFEHMRGAPRLAANLAHRYRLDEEITAHTITMLSRAFFFQKFLNMKTREIGEILRVPETSLRRVAAEFSEVIEQYSPTERHEALLTSTPAEARHTFSGQERLTLLCCAKSRGGSSSRKRSSDSHLARVLGTATPSADFCLSVIASFLPVVLRGGTAFASHSLYTMDHYDQGGTSREGHTSLVVLNPGSSTFTLMESQVTGSTCFSAIISGIYRKSSSYQSNTSLRFTLHCGTKKEGFFGSPEAKNEGGGAADEGDKEATWEWSEEEKIPSSEAPQLQYIVERDMHSDGLVISDASASRSGGGGGGGQDSAPPVGLREIHLEEIGLLEQLYGGTLTSAGQMLAHRSWTEIPAPPQMRKRS